MSMNEKLIQAIKPIVPVCEPDGYDGEADEYCVFSATELGACFGDDRPTAICFLVSLHYYLPRGCNPIAKKKQIAQALSGADFTWPSITNASDEAGQHYVFECEWAEGAD